MWLSFSIVCVLDLSMTSLIPSHRILSIGRISTSACRRGPHCVVTNICLFGVFGHGGCDVGSAHSTGCGGKMGRTPRTTTGGWFPFPFRRVGRNRSSRHSRSSDQRGSQPRYHNPPLFGQDKLYVLDIHNLAAPMLCQFDGLLTNLV